MSDKPVVWFDFELCFTSGQILPLSAQEGRDTIAMDDARLRVLIRHTPDVTEEVLVQRSALAYMRTTKREVQPEATSEDGGRLTLVGALEG